MFGLHLRRSFRRFDSWEEVTVSDGHARLLGRWRREILRLVTGVILVRQHNREPTLIRSAHPGTSVYHLSDEHTQRAAQRSISLDGSRLHKEDQTLHDFRVLMDVSEDKEL